MAARATPWSAEPWLDQLLDQACQQQWSDIHINADEHHWTIRSRQHGCLQPQHRLTHPQGMAVMACIKVKAKLNITEHRRIQEGRLSHHYKKQTVACRVTTCPTFWGEKAALRLLHHQRIRQLSQLGMSKEQLSVFSAALSQPDGLIIVCGPTGSGKSNTLAAAMHHLSPHRHCVSLEDPVEIPIPNTTQIPLNSAIGMDYPRTFKGCLRLDPDVITIGEIRDAATAQLAIHAAQTGHLILCTIHSQDGPGVLDRLQQLGIKRSLSLPLTHCIVQQRMKMGTKQRSKPQFVCYYRKIFEENANNQKIVVPADKSRERDFLILP